MISHRLSRFRSGIVDQGPVCRARGRTRRTSARHFPRDGHRPAVHRFRPCRLHAAALYLCLEGFHRRCCDPRAGFRQAAVGPPDQAPPGQNLAKYHPPRRHPPSVSRPGARSAQNVRRLGSAGRIPPPSTVCASSAVEEAPLQARITSIQALLASAEEADCRRARIRDRCRQSPSPRSGAPTRPKQSSGTKRRQRDLPCPRTESSNPFPSSKESATNLTGKIEPALARNRRFESSSLQRRVACEPDSLTLQGGDIASVKRYRIAVLWRGDRERPRAATP
jgi:hypothetical protein